MSKNDVEATKEILEPTERSIGKTLFDFAMWVTTLTFLIFLFSVATSPVPSTWPDIDWKTWWLTDVGRSFLKDASWLLPTFLAIVLAFYAALIGQKATNTEREEVLRTRRRLVPAGLGVASAVFVLAGAGALASVFEPAEWPRTPGLFITALAICLLGIGVGRFETQSFDDKMKNARSQRRVHRALLRRLPGIPASVSTRPRTVIFCTTAVAVIVPTLFLFAALLVNGQQVVPALITARSGLLVNLFVTGVGIGLPMVLINSAYTGMQSWKTVKNIGAGVLTVSLAAWAIIGLFLVAHDPSELLPVDPTSFLLFLPGVVVCAIVEISLFASPRRFPPVLFSLTLRGAVVALIRRSSTARIATLKKEIAQIKANAAKQTQ